MANVVEIVLRGVDRLKAPFTRSIRTMDDFRRSVRGLAVISAGAATAAGGALLRIASDTARAAEESANLAETVGFGVESFSKLQFAAEVSEIAISDLRVGLNALNRNMLTAATNAEGQFASVFRNLGVPVRDLEGNLRSNEEVLLDLADALAGMEDGAEKSATALKVMGESGGRLLPLLNLGSRGIQDLANQTIGFSEEFVDQSRAFNRNMGILRRQVFDIGVVISVQLLPFLNELVGWFIETQRHANALGRASNFVAGSLRVLSVAVGFLVFAFRQLGRVFQAQITVMITSAITVAQTIAGIFDDIKSNFDELRAFGLALATGDVFGIADGAKTAGKVADQIKDRFETAFQGLTATVGGEVTGIIEGMESDFNALLELAGRIGDPGDAPGVSRRRQPEGVAGKGATPLQAENESLINNLRLKEASLEILESQKQLETEIALLQEGAHQREIARLNELAAFHQSFQQIAIAAHQGWLSFLARTTDTVFNGLTNAITSIITGARSAKEAFKALGEQMVAMVVNFIAQRVIAFAIEKVLAATGRALLTATAATTAGVAASMAAAWAPAATASLIATFGSSAGAAGLLTPLMAANAATASSLALAGGLVGGAAGGGLDFVPNDSTFLVHRGERILQPEANRDLTDFLQDRQTDRGGPVEVTINLDGQVLARAVSDLSRDGRLELNARSVI